MTASPLAQKATDAFNAPICETDPEIAELLDSELGRQRNGKLQNRAAQFFCRRLFHFYLASDISILSYHNTTLPPPPQCRRNIFAPRLTSSPKPGKL